MTKADDTDSDAAEVWDAFNEAVNMTPVALRKHLDSDASKAVGQKDDDGESTGHAMGRRILAIKDKKKADLDADDYAAMRKVVGYVHRHLKQGGKARSDPDSPWRMSLMNWGHDPQKD